MVSREVVSWNHFILTIHGALMTEATQIALINAVIAAVVLLLTPIIAALVALIKGNQDAAKERIEAKAARETADRDLKEIHSLTNSAKEAVTTKADERERAGIERADERYVALEQLLRSAIESRPPTPDAQVVSSVGAPVTSPKGTTEAGEE